jgi:hypothetical protein
MKSWSRFAAFTLGAASVLAMAGVASGAPVGSAPSAATAAPVALKMAAPPPTSRQPASESSYIAITPCRIIDTRNGTGVNGTKFQSNQTRTYYVGGTTGFAPQGGKSGGCGIPVGASAISTTVTAVDPDGKGYVRAWPNGEAEPSATFLNYGTTSTSGGGAVSINPSSAYALKIHNYYGPTDIVVDVFGYYIKPLAGMISETGAPYAGSSRITGSVRAAQGIFDVTFDRNIVYCNPAVTVYFDNYYANADTYALGSNTVRVKVYNASGVLQDAFFYITVTC